MSGVLEERKLVKAEETIRRLEGEYVCLKANLLELRQKIGLLGNSFDPAQKVSR